MSRYSAKNRIGYVLVLLLTVLALAAFAWLTRDRQEENSQTVTAGILPSAFDYSALPAYSGSPAVTVNGNEPYFTDEERSDYSWISLGEPDSLGRCTAVIACLGEDLMPAEGEERQDVTSVRPTGLSQAWFDCVEQGALYNRCHMVGWKLSGLNAEPKNLIAGTRYLNLEMREYESRIAQYLWKTGGHVMYRCSPVFVGQELLCRGLLLEAESVEDRGESVRFCAFLYNVQPGIGLDYADGDSWYTGVFQDTKSEAVALGENVEQADEQGRLHYVVSEYKDQFHLPGCEKTESIWEESRSEYYTNRQELLDQGYEPCPACHP